MKKQEIAILGATSHIAKGLILNFSKGKQDSLNLFARSPGDVKHFLSDIQCPNGCYVGALSGFNKKEYDVIINCIGGGVSSLSDKEALSLFEVTEAYDNMILEYLKKRRDTIYINFSSGAVYGDEFMSPGSSDKANSIRINQINPSQYYSIAKLNAEAKHRYYSDLRIIDLRVFAYFSRFIDPNAHYLMAEVIKALRTGEILMTGAHDIVRDYIGHDDLFALVCRSIESKKNGVYDVYSRKPVKKFEILKAFEKEFGLKYKNLKSGKFSSATGVKSAYYSRNKQARKIGYTPQYNSLELLITETKAMLA